MLLPRDFLEKESKQKSIQSGVRKLLIKCKYYCKGTNMKNLLVASFMIVSSVTANAGSVTFTPPQAAVLEEPARMGGSGAWLIPLVILAVVALAASKQSGSSCYAQSSANSRSVAVSC